MLKAFILFLLPLSAIADMTPIKYPFRAEQLNISGVIDVKYDINAKGLVENVRVIKADPKGIFEREVIKGVRVWSFPAGNPKQDVNARFVFEK